MELTTTICALHPKAVFRISRAERTEVRNVFVRLEEEGITGYGEASPNAFYHENADDVQARLSRVAPWLRGLKIRSVADIARIWEEIWPVVSPSRSAQCAVDVALWDWLARRENRTICELAWGELPRPVATFVTIGISTPEELSDKVAELHGFPLIKIKSDTRADIGPVRFVRERTGAALAIDANCAWGGHDVAALAHQLAALGVKFLEQPFAPEADALMPKMLAASPLPIIADESFVVLEDVERMPGCFSGFNIKLTKCGGLTPALRMARRAKELGLQTMVGCMLESSVLISAGAAVAQHTDFADLDGAWLIRDDPFHGIRYEKGVLHMEERVRLAEDNTGLRWRSTLPKLRDADTA
jgi:L-alanine-DL-glutamate epimerase-like enolase superfamily enzyme